MRPPLVRLRSAAPPPPEQVRAGGAVELRGDRRLCFYAATFNTPTVITEPGPTGAVERYREVIRPGAFAATLAAGADVIANREHDPATTFARTSTGLVLQEDARGLFASCYLDPGPAADQVLTDVRSGKLRGASFKFVTVEDRRTPQPGGLDLVELLAVRLIDVCVTWNPAYPGTVVSVRSDADAARGRRLRLLKLRAGGG